MTSQSRTLEIVLKDVLVLIEDWREAVLAHRVDQSVHLIDDAIQHLAQFRLVVLLRLRVR